MKISEQPLRIVHVLTRLLPAGTEENTIAVARRQAMDGHLVSFIHGRQFSEVLTRSLASEFEVFSVPELVHRIAPVEDVLAFLKLRSLLKRLKPHVVHTHQSKAGITGCAAAASVGVPGIVHGVHILPWVNAGRFRAAAYIGMERLFARFARTFIDVSPGVREECLRHGVGQPRQHFVAHSPVETARFREAAPAEDLAKPPGDIIVLMLAAFEPRKRQEAFLKALADLSPPPNLRLVFAGDGPTLANARELARRCFAPGQVLFLGHRDDPERLIASADICVLTSSREGLPRSLLQYLAGGRASVVTALPGLADVLAPGVNGSVAATPADAAAEVLRLALDETARHRLAEGARATDLSEWDIDRGYPQVMQAYDHALRRTSAEVGEIQPSGSPSEPLSLARAAG